MMNMNKVDLIAAATVVVLMGGTFADSAMAQQRDRVARPDRLTAGQVVALEDARTARIKADLRLTADQEKSWPGLEAALHDIGRTRADRQVAFRADREGRKEPDDLIEHLNDRAKILGDRSAEVKKLADAAQPLYASLDAQQKRRFAGELMRVIAGRHSPE
jgi:LTXXQ motif family protein